MTPLALAWKLAVLEEFPALATRLEREHWQPATKRVWYGSQREHWLGYLQWRQDRGDRDGPACYGRIQCLPMLIWLADAVKVEESVIIVAAQKALLVEDLRLPGWPARSCTEFRRHIPWETIAKALK